MAAQDKSRSWPPQKPELLSPSEWTAEFNRAKVAQPDFRVKSVDEFKAITNHYISLVNDGQVVNRFHLTNGGFIQCVAIETQHSFLQSGGVQGAIPSPPYPLSNSDATGPNKTNAESFGVDGTFDEDGNTRQCPAGSFPRLIPNLENFYRFSSLEDFFRKYSKQEEGLELSEIHEWAGADKSVDNWGSSAIFNVWSPFVAPADEFSLSQLWVARGVGSDLQSAEAGWQKYPGFYGDSNPHLFIYFTTSGYTSSGNNVGCYNTTCTGFVQVDGSVVIGGQLSPVSTFGGQQYEEPIAFIRDSNSPANWWLSVNNTWVGYYPTTLYDSQGLESKSDRVNFGGEIVNRQTDGNHTTTQMGSGHFPSEGVTHAAYTRNLQYRDTSNSDQQATGLQRYVQSSNGPAVTNYYDLILNPSSISGWGQWFLFGGPGNGTANPTVSSSLTLSPSGGSYPVNQTLTAQFSITNRGSSAITFQRLTAGGRLNNDNTCSGGCPDFTFATNITLNAGATYNYTGTQVMSRAGSYGFFVAYQKTDGSWVTSVPTDAGVTNTASATVGGAANPMVSSSLTLSPAGGSYPLNQTLTAQFSITNRGSSAITFQRLTAGGRLNNDNTCSGGCPDFTFATNITLNAGATYNYTGTQVMSRAGSYGFFVAYQKTDGSWVTSVPTDAGVTNTASATVGGAANPMVSSSLTLSPAGGSYPLNQTLTAQFSITNRGNAAITFSRLGAGGRLNNDNTCAGGCPDFTFATNVTLNAGATYNYSGTQVMSRAGSYGFYVAYQKTDGNWVTNVPADAGVTNTASATVNSPTQTIAWEFNSAGNFEGWSATNASSSSVTGGKYFIDPSGADPYTTGPAISASASTYQYFIVNMASNGLDSTGAVYFKTQAENFYSEDKKVVFTVSNCSLCGTAGFVRYAVFMSGNAKWTGTITALRLDPTGSGQGGTNSDSIGIDYIRLSSSSLAFSRSLSNGFESLLALNGGPIQSGYSLFAEAENLFQTDRPQMSELATLRAGNSKLAGSFGGGD